jgi:formate hydrogenlyase subunit 3/multisubunit Na+/H+ antiporter MnhD subunit
MNHAIIKSLLFLCAGSFIHQTKTRNLSELAGIRQRMPVTSLFFSIGAIAITAIPPFNGFWSEWMIVSAGIEAGMLLFSVLMIVNVIFSVAYYLRVVYVIVLRSPTATSDKAVEVPLPMLIPTGILASLCILIGVYPGPFIEIVSKAAQAALNLQAYINF